MPFTLPDEPLPPLQQNPKFVLIYGPRKVGKTSQIIKIPNNLVIDLEDGTDYVSGLKVKIPMETPNWQLTEITNKGASDKDNEYWTYPSHVRTPFDCYDDFKELCMEIRRQRKYKFITIDTVDKLEEWCLALARKNYKASNMGRNYKQSDITTLPEGAGYKWTREAFKEILQETLSLAPHVIFIGHVRDKLQTSTATEVDSKDLDLIGKHRSILCSYCDTVGHMYRKVAVGAAGGEIGLNFKSHENVLCSSRVPHVTGKVFEFKTDIDWTKIFLPEK